MKRLNLTFLALFRSSLRRPWIALALAALMFGFGVRNVPKLHYRLSSSDLIDPKLQSTRDFLELKERFSIRPSAFVVIKPPGGAERFTAEDLCRIHRSFVGLRLEYPAISGFFSALDLRLPRIDGGAAPRHLTYPLLVDPCVPGADAAGLARLNDTPWRLIMTSREAGDLVAQVSLYPLNPPGRYGQVDVLTFDKVVASLEAKLNMPVAWSGEITFNSYFLKGLKRTQVLNLCALLLILVFLRLLHGTWRSGAMFIALVVVINAFVHGTMGFFGRDVNPLTSGIFLLITISALEDYLFVSSRIFESPGVHWRSAFRTILMPGFFTSLTTAVGFLSLCVSQLDVIREFGLWTSLGAICEWLGTFFALPALMRAAPFFAAWVRPERVPAFFTSKSFIKRTPAKPLTWALILLVPLSLWIGGKMKLNFSPLDMFPRAHVMHRNTEDVRAHHGWVANVSLVFPDGDDKAAIKSVLAKVERLPNVVSVEDSIRELEFATRGLERPERELIERETSHTAQGERLHRMDGPRRAILYVADIDVDSMLTLQREVAAVCGARERCFLAGELVAFSDFSRQILDTLFASLATSVLLVGAIIFALARARRSPHAWALLFSTIWGPSLLLALITLSHISINIVSSVILSIIVGLTGDNAVQYLFASRRGKLEDGIQRVGVASVHCAVVMAATSLVLTASYFQPVRHLGWLLSLALLASLFGDLWLLRGLLGLRRGKA